MHLSKTKCTLTRSTSCPSTVTPLAMLKGVPFWLEMPLLQLVILLRRHKQCNMASEYHHDMRLKNPVCVIGSLFINNSSDRHIAKNPKINATASYRRTSAALMCPASLSLVSFTSMYSKIPSSITIVKPTFDVNPEKKTCSPVQEQWSSQENKPPLALP